MIGRRAAAIAVLALGAAVALAVAPGVAAAAEPPTLLSVDDASAVTYTTAAVSGVVERAADPAPASNADCDFEYVIDAQFRGTGFRNASRLACDVDPITVPGPNPVAAEITGLKPGAMYHLRLTASNPAGSDSLDAANTFTTTAIAAPSVTISAPCSVTPTSAHFSGTIDPQLGGGDPGLYEVKWHFQCTPECRGADGEPVSGPPIPGDNTTHAVAADAVLEPNVDYRVTLVASNAGGSASAGPVSFTTGTLPPLARTLAAEVQTETAQLGAKLNSHNSSLEYRFEWGLTEDYGTFAPATPEALPTADNAFHLVAEPIGGLQPQTSYHYRVVATNPETDEQVNGADRSFTTPAPPQAPPVCPNEASRVGASAGLPDCRAFELATPGLGGTGPAGGWPSIIVEGVRADGRALAFATSDAPAQAEGAATTKNTVLAQRGASGWSTRSLSGPTPVASGTYFGSDRATVGLSADLSESVLWSNQPLVGSSSPTGTNLYLHRADGSFVALTKIGAPTFSAGGELSGASQDFKHLFVVSTVKQLGTDPVAAGNTYEWVNGDLRLVAVLPGLGEEPAPGGGSLPDGALPAVSDDGSMVLFKAAGLPGLYLRVEGRETIEVSASQQTVDPDPNPPAAAEAVGMTADGSTVLFTSASELTDDAYTGRSAGVADDQGADLYSYDVASGKLSDLTVDEDPADVARGADVERVLGASPDASYVYFVATGNLAPGAISGERNLYVVHEGKVDYVGDDPIPDPAEGDPFYVTPNGRYAAFVTAAPQTGYDNAGQQQVYRYSYEVGLECASCRPSGEPPAAGASIAGRALSDDGSRLFFQSSDAIVPRAQSGQANVFEYQGGEVHLLTPGDGSASLLVGAGADGKDVFIASFEELSPQGQGTVFGIYDVRVDADVAPPTETAGCQGESCRGTGTTSPVVESPGSAGFEAPGRVSVSAPKAIKGRKASLRVFAPGSGNLTITGRGLIAVSRPVGKAGPLNVVLTLKPGAVKKLRHKSAFKTEVEVLYRSAAGETSRAATALKFEARKRKGGK